MHEARASRYTAVAIGLHWAIASAVLFMIWLGWNMDQNQVRYQLHKSIGITILILTVARIVWRGLNPPPPLPVELPRWEKSLSHAVHIGFYGLMFAMPLTGWLVVSTSYKFDVPTVLFGVISWPDIPGVGFLSNATAHGVIEFVHSKLAWVTIGLLAPHVAGALKHELTKEEGVLKRMIPGLFGKTSPPAWPQRGFFAAFGGAFALFALIAGSPLVAGALQAKTQTGAGQAAGPNSTQTLTKGPLQSGITATSPDFKGNWQIDMTQSSIAFSGIHDGKPYTGTFGDWQGEIAFDPADLAKARALITVKTGSAKASQKLYTDSLKSAEWLNSGAFDTAQVTLSDFAKQGGAYTAKATLLLKGIKFETPLRFELVIKGDEATAKGQAILLRKSLNLGQTSDPKAEWVAEEVKVDIRVVAKRRA